MVKLKVIFLKIKICQITNKMAKFIKKIEMILEYKMNISLPVKISIISAEQPLNIKIVENNDFSWIFIHHFFLQILRMRKTTFPY